MAHTLIVPVILSGGSGTRLWPLSRASLPKQFLELTGEGSLFQQTFGRVGSKGLAQPIVICSGQHRFLIERQMQDIGAAASRIVLEPFGRNTAPAAAIAAMIVARMDPEGVVILLPSDHVVRNTVAFGHALDQAITGAKIGQIVTFGIAPSSPEIGYGYIEQGDPIAEADGLYRVKRFVEKPDRKTAQSYLAHGGYSWNSGMFVFRADVLMAECEQHCPSVLYGAQLALQHGKEEGAVVRLDALASCNTPDISIDYAVMEKTDRAVVVPCDIGWSDVGSWSALWDLEIKDPDCNVFKGEVVSHNTCGSYVHSPAKLVALVGAKDLVVVGTDDAILVADRDAAQDVKQVVGMLKCAHRAEGMDNKLVHHPWGTHQTIASEASYQVQQIMVRPGGRLSLQLDRARSKHLTVVGGAAQVTCGEKVFVLNQNESTFIPLGLKHRLENHGETPLILINVQYGTDIAEGGSTRFDDSHVRAW